MSCRALSIAAPATVFFMRQFMLSSLPLELLDLARIDGSGESNTFNRIALPRGTNEARPVLTPLNAEDDRLWAKNKWLLAHPDSGELYECPVTVENEQGMLKDVVVIVPTMDATGTHIDSFRAGDQMNLTFSGNVCHVFGQDGKNLEF